MSNLLGSLIERASSWTVIHAQQHAQRRASEQNELFALSELADEAYIYGYPLVMMDLTARTMTNVAVPAGAKAPLNQFGRLDILPTADTKNLTMPNVDTLYMSAFLDLKEEPIVLHVPDTHRRYYMLPMLDAYTNVFASPGKRTTGTTALDAAIVGPHWTQSLPSSLVRIDAPTNLVWIVGRTQVNGREDLSDVAELTQQYTLCPLSSYGQRYSLPPNPRLDPALLPNAEPAKLVAELEDHGFFAHLANLLAQYPPPPRDGANLVRYERLGLAPGHFTPSPAAAEAIEGVKGRATKQIRQRFLGFGREINGWRIDTTLGQYDSRYLDRAAIARYAIGANLADDAIYPYALYDAEDQPLHGANDYVLHFEVGGLPPVDALWSLTLYNQRGHLVHNHIERYAVGDRDPLVHNADGSIEIFIQQHPPQPHVAPNWLPSPDAPFYLLLRLYWPQPSVLSGRWVPPKIQRISSVPKYRA